MNPSGAIQIAGFKSLLATDGEKISLRVGSAVVQQISGLVNRGGVKGKDLFALMRAAPVNFDVSSATAIEILKTDAMPVAGDSFDDTIGFRHRVRVVTFTDITWMCFCTPVKLA